MTEPGDPEGVVTRGERLPHARIWFAVAFMVFWACVFILGRGDPHQRWWDAKLSVMFLTMMAAIVGTIVLFASASGRPARYRWAVVRDDLTPDRLKNAGGWLAFMAGAIVLKELFVEPYFGRSVWQPLIWLALGLVLGAVGTVVVICWWWITGEFKRER